MINSMWIKSDVKMWGILCGLFISVKNFKWREGLTFFIIIITGIFLLQKKQCNRETTNCYQKALSLPLNWRNQD